MPLSKVEAATQWMENLANDNTHGYTWGGWGPQDYDCGHAVITAWEYAGVPVKSRGASYTGNMREVFIACGFKDVTAGINLQTGAGLKRGDILLNIELHTAMYVGSNKIVHARSAEGNTIPGDQSGNEIRIQSYWNYPWDCVLRYIESSSAVDDEPSTGTLDPDGICGPKTWEVIAELVKQMPTLECVVDSSGKIIKMPTGDHVEMLQAFLNYHGASLVKDGEFGPLTKQAVIDFQSTH